MHFISIIKISPWECESYTIKWDANMYMQDSLKKGLNVICNQWVWIKVNIEISKASKVNHIYNNSVIIKVQTRTTMWRACKLTTKQQQANYLLQLVIFTLRIK